MSFRWRLTLSYATLLGLTLLIASLLSFTALRHTLYAGLDESLRVLAQHQAAQQASNLPEPPAQVKIALDILNRQQPARLTIYSLGATEIGWGPS